MVEKKCYLQGVKLPISEYVDQPSYWIKRVFGVQCYAENMLKMNIEPTVPTMRVPMTRLDDDDSLCDVWLSNGQSQLKSGQYNAIKYRYDDELLFGVIELSDTLFAESMAKTPLQLATETAYNQIFSLLDLLSFPYLFRVRNYIADINVESFGLERYVQFNLGRQDAFLNHGRDVVGNVPAACALGFESVMAEGQSPQNALTITFLAGRVQPQSIENPRQISAYQYPQQYGPRSPTFSRASLVKLGSDDILFLSGTASIVGHETLHIGDIVAQTRETIENIKAVLAEANRQLKETKFELASLYYTVYVRDLDDLDVIRKELKCYMGESLKAVYLQANICRQDLLVEVEATAGHLMVISAGDVKDCTSNYDHMN